MMFKDQLNKQSENIKEEPKEIKELIDKEKYEFFFFTK